MSDIVQRLIMALENPAEYFQPDGTPKMANLMRDALSSLNGLAALTGKPVPTFTFEEKLDAVRRELRFRRRVYARQVEGERMDADFANRQIKLFEEIEADYVKAVDAGRLI